MIDTEVMADGIDDYDDEEEEIEEDDLFHDIYVEVATDFLYEVQLFDDFCLVRLASPNTYAAIRKLSIIDFTREFREYGGDAEAVRNYLRGVSADLVVE